MVKIQVGSTMTTFDKDGNVTSQTEKPSYLVKEDGSKQELSKEEAKVYGIGRDEPNEPAMQSSMGYICHFCRDIFLIGWEHTYSNKKYCQSCRKKSSLPDNHFIEKVY